MAKAKQPAPLLAECDDIDNFQNLELHPLCSMFPEASEEDYDSLVSSMKQRGFMPTEFVVVIANEDQSDFLVLDGRNRLTACLDSGVTPKFMEYVGDDPMGYVLARNLDRRHLSAGQKAALAAKIANMEVGENQFDKDSSKVTQEEAAKLVKSNTTNIAKFKRVQDADPDLAKEVELGAVSLDAAYTKVSKPKEPGGGTGQTPQEATASAPKPKESQPKGTEDTGPTGSEDMAFDVPKGKVISIKVDRGPWESSNEAENEYNQSHPVILVGLGPQSFRLSVKELTALVKSGNDALAKLA